MRRLEGTSAPSNAPVEDQEDEVQTEKRDQSKEKEKGAEKEKKGKKAQGGKVEEKQEEKVVPKDLEASTDGFRMFSTEGFRVYGYPYRPQHTIKGAPAPIFWKSPLGVVFFSQHIQDQSG